MEFINLGNAGPRQESDLSGLSEALARGLQIGVQAREARSREDALRSTLAQSALENKERSEKIQRDIAQTNTENERAAQKSRIEAADFELKTEVESQKHARQKLEDYSNAILSKDPQTQAIMRGNPQMQAMEKELLKVLGPSYKDDKGQLLLIPKEKIAEDKLNQTYANILDKVHAQDPKNPLTPGDMAFLNEYKQMGSPAMGSIITAASNDEEWDRADSDGQYAGMPDEQRRKIIYEKYKSAFGAGRENTLTSGLAQDPKDPLGIRRRFNE